MNPLEFRKQGRSKVTSPIVFGEKIQTTPVSEDGLQLIVFSFQGKQRCALIRAFSDWELHLFEEDNALIACSFDQARNTISVERFEPGYAPKRKELKDTERTTILGDSFQTMSALDIAISINQIL